MASTFSPPSKSVSSFSLPQIKRSATSEKTSTTSAGIRPRLVLKFSSKNKNKTDDVVSSVTEKTLVATNGEESTKDKIKEAEKRQPTFSAFSISLGREKIEADLLAMTGGSKLSKRSAANKKRTMSLQNSFQDDLSSFSTDSSSDSMGSRYNLAVETSVNENKKNDDMVAIDAKDQSQIPVSTKFAEPEKVKTRKNTRKVSDAVNKTLIVTNGNAAESLPIESTQPGIAPLTKSNWENLKKRTFSMFSVSLTREEIEADYLAMGGSMRNRGIKKRPKNVQRQLDNLFPGLRLKYITPNDYRGREDKN